MQLSEKGLKLIAAFEGCKLKLYNDPVGYCTIGYGHLVHKGKTGTNSIAEAPYVNGLTQEEALELLRQDAALHVNGVNACVRVPLKQNQFDALVSLCFNIGTGGLKASSLIRYINTGGNNPKEISRLFGLWCRAGGRVHAGLVGRRRTEANVYNGS